MATIGLITALSLISLLVVNCCGHRADSRVAEKKSVVWLGWTGERGTIVGAKLVCLACLTRRGWWLEWRLISAICEGLKGEGRRSERSYWFLCCASPPSLKPPG